MKVCPCCGHPLPLLDVMLELSPMQQRMVTILHKAGRAGIEPRLLVDKLYADEESGGPDYASKLISVQRWRMAAKLAKHGLKISHGHSRSSIWRLEAISQQSLREKAFEEALRDEENI